MSDEQIAKLEAKIAKNEIVYFCLDGKYWTILAVIRNWVEFVGAPPEPAAMLDDCTFTSLWNSEPEQFVEMRLAL